MHRQSWGKSSKTGRLNSINPSDYAQIVFFTGAGMSAESGIPTYRGEGGIWEEYNWEEVACEEAFQNDPKKVLEFHEIRRKYYFRTKKITKLIKPIVFTHMGQIMKVTRKYLGYWQLEGNI